MSEWGLPNWRNEEAYPKELTVAVWRWQFIRKTKAYRDYYDENAVLWYEEHLPRHLAAKAMFDAGQITEIDGDFAWVFALDRPDGDIPYNLKDAFSHPDDLYFICDCPDDNPFGFEFLVNPRRHEPESGLFHFGRGAPLTIHRRGDQIPDPEESQLVFTVNLLLPTGDQIKQATVIVAKRKKRLNIKDKRPRLEHYPHYLQVLDAKEAGASLSEVAQLLPKAMSNRSEQAAGNFLTQAEEVRDSI